ncbi:alpha-glucosidase [Weissella uvarum]|uniref:alpha-glucosidase n=1 Tax=Weissella uvarum TaxID=1479233 RepID=UPI00196001D4|nr:alpha-glucosidase [Weissella uvarum]MBM7616721.1 alpha-glucosidase [Weissella uvarum]MCM0594824.1 alpha-glucosidase [Weissella uvarum]
MENKQWWKDEVIYQIYPMSFKDSNGDGIGDIPGITQKLNYLEDLGITMIWLSPIYKSPMVDNGYDVSDYRDVNPMFGTLEDLEKFIVEAKQHGIKVILDLVVNHTSDQHEWFKKAIADPSSKYHDYYIFKPGRGVDESEPPTNWRSNFGQASSWTQVPETGEWYHHVFSPQQPDLNWENPAVREEIYDMVNWWLEKGIAGFRVDAITFIKKNQSFEDISPDGNDGLGKVKRMTENQPGIEVFLKELNEKTFKPFNAVTIGEASGVPYEEYDQFIGQDGYFSMIFDFKYADIDIYSGSEMYKQRDWTIDEWRDRIFKSQTEIQKVGWSANFLENHDQPRSASKFIKDPAWRNHYGATALATLYFFLRGTPFIYQGQEIGMLNAERSKIDEFNDISTWNNYRRALEEGWDEQSALAAVNRRSRDNARTPMQWNATPKVGFTTGTPWLAVAGNAPEFNVADQQSDANSTLNFYKEMIDLHYNSDLALCLTYGEFIGDVNTPDEVISYQRIYQNQKVKILINLSNQVQKMSNTEGQVRLNNWSKALTNKNELQPYQAIVMECE